MTKEKVGVWLLRKTEQFVFDLSPNDFSFLCPDKSLKVIPELISFFLLRYLLSLSLRFAWN